MSVLGLSVSLLVAAVALALIVLTASGARRRGNGRVAAGLAGIAFPVTWVAWYVRDEHSRRR